MENSSALAEQYSVILLFRLLNIIGYLIYSFILVFVFAAFRDIEIIDTIVILVWVSFIYLIIRTIGNLEQLTITADGRLTLQKNRRKIVQVNLRNLSQIEGKPGSRAGGIALTMTDREGSKVSFIPGRYSNSSRLLESIYSGGQYSNADFTGLTNWVKRVHIDPVKV